MTGFIRRVAFLFYRLSIFDTTISPSLVNIKVFEFNLRRGSDPASAKQPARQNGVAEWYREQYELQCGG